MEDSLCRYVDTKYSRDYTTSQHHGPANGSSEIGKEAHPLGETAKKIPSCSAQNWVPEVSPAYASPIPDTGA